MPPSRLEMLRSFAASKPQDPFPRYALAHELKNNGDLAGAWVEFETLLRDHAGYVAGYLHAGNALVALGRVDDARDVYQKGVQVSAACGDGHARGELEGALASLPLAGRDG